jgi:hypothetical protein
MRGPMQHLRPTSRLWTLAARAALLAGLLLLLSPSGFP